jgi:DHA2 family multidrug resistance protein-like MFS transporter
VLVRRFPIEWVVGGGMMLCTVGFALLVGLDVAPGVWTIVASTSIMFIGISIAVLLTTDLIISTAPQEQAGAASAISETGAELGLALGVAVLGSLGTAIYRSEVAVVIPAGVPADVSRPILDTLGAATSVASRLGEHAGPVLDAARAAFVDGVQVIAVISASITAALLVLVATMLRRARAGS